MNLPSVDIILPFHRDDSLLLEAIQSISKSQGVEVRLILVDDRRDPRNNLDFTQFLQGSIKDAVLIKANGKGYSKAINLAKAEIRSSYVAIMNSDDLVAKDKLLLQVNSLASSNSEICIGRLKKFSEKGRIPSLSGEVDVDHYDFKYLLLGAYGADAAIMTTAAVFSQILFEENCKSADWATAFRYYPNLKIIGRTQSVYHYRMHSDQITNDPRQKEKNFKEIYPYWAELNARLGLPSLNFATAAAIAAPTERNNLDGFDLQVLKDWESKYIKLFFSSTQRKNVKALIARRHCVLLMRKKIIVFDVVTLIVMLIEVLIARHRGTSPR